MPSEFVAVISNVRPLFEDETLVVCHEKGLPPEIATIAETDCGTDCGLEGVVFAFLQEMKAVKQTTKAMRIFCFVFISEFVYVTCLF